MLARALIVVLAVLNLGVAAWWLSRAAEPVRVVPAEPAAAGVATLRLAGPADVEDEPVEDPVAASAVAPATPEPPTPTPVPAPAQPRPVEATAHCLSLGPFAAQAEAQVALGRVGALLEKGAVREEHVGDAESYRVVMPSVGDRAAAQAITRRIVEAGLGDYYVLTQGEDNTIALGRYRNRGGAERRQAELKAKGFSAELLASGGQSRWWVDARTRAAAASLLARSGAARQRSLDCAAMR
ncbi:MAG: hypothetical protein QM581_16630 [Pseudomonas sp.]